MSEEHLKRKTFCQKFTFQKLETVPLKLVQAEWVVHEENGGVDIILVTLESLTHKPNTQTVRTRIALGKPYPFDVTGDVGLDELVRQAVPEITERIRPYYDLSLIATHGLFEAH